MGWNNNRSITLSSHTGGVEKVTIASNVGRASTTEKDIRSCMIKADSGNAGTITVNIRGVADANDWPVATIAEPIPVDDLSALYFYGSNNGDVVYVIWRS